jgi:septum site-determining protein MinC
MSGSDGAARCDAFDVDGTVAPVTVLRLKTDNVARIEKGVRAFVASARRALPYAPVVVDLAGLDETSARELPLHDLAERLRACKLLPVGAANLPPAAVWNAAAAGMAVVQLSTASEAPKPAAEPAPVEPPRVEEPPPALAAPPSTLTIRQPVRSGQVIYAKGGDLVVVAPVNPGAQVIADGHIHVYGPLRGRALAGAQGMTDAFVFCRSLEAELVSIAGHFIVADEIPAAHRGRPTQLSIENGRFLLDAL